MEKIQNELYFYYYRNQELQEEQEEIDSRYIYEYNGPTVDKFKNATL